MGVQNLVPFVCFVSTMNLQIVKGEDPEGKGGVVMDSGGFLSPPQLLHSTSCTPTVLGQW